MAAGNDHQFTDPTRGPRLQKVLAEAGLGSRRACEELIESGVVTVNGHVVCSMPAWVDPVRDHVKVRGRLIRSEPEHIYVMLFKPRGVVCTNDDPQGRRRAVDLVRHPSRARLYPVGRLDLDSSGLLLLTNDGEMANRLTHPRYGVHKTYEITVRGTIDDKEMARLERGLFIDDRRTRRASRTGGARMRLLKRDRDRTRMRIELREGRNRQIRRMMAILGHPVKKLRRIEMGPLRLRGLRPGQWRELDRKELGALRRAAGLD
ncbi:MAG: pseudouridine synthase [Planctomycetota bacterium]